MGMTSENILKRAGTLTEAEQVSVVQELRELRSLAEVSAVYLDHLLQFFDYEEAQKSLVRYREIYPQSLCPVCGELTFEYEGLKRCRDCGWERPLYEKEQEN